MAERIDQLITARQKLFARIETGVEFPPDEPNLGQCSRLTERK